MCIIETLLSKSAPIWKLCLVFVLQLQSDQDRGQVRYVLSGEGAGTVFVIDENNGDLHATRRLDREEKAFYVLRATVVSKETGQKLEPETEFIIKLHDINDNEPQFSKEVYVGSVPERSDIGEHNTWGPLKYLELGRSPDGTNWHQDLTMTIEHHDGDQTKTE